MEKVSIDDIVNVEEVYLASYLECPIDNMISMNPMMCKKCETIFCSDCIENWKKKSNQCPMRCNPIELVPIERTVMRQQLNKIKLACPFQKFGCLSLIPVNDLQRHEKVCEYRGTKCEKCLEVVPMILINSHLFESCEKNKLPCLICDSQLNLKSVVPHLESCRVNSLCNLCIQVIPNEAEHSINCSLKLSECPLCKLPDINWDIKQNKHKCINEIKFKETNLNTYLKSIHAKIETYFNLCLQKHDDKLKEFNKKYNLLSNEVYRRENERCLNLELKYSKISDEQFKKISIVKKEKLEVINKLQAEIGELDKIVKDKEEEMKVMDIIMDKNRDLLKKEYELKLSSKRQNLDYLRNLIMQSSSVKPENNNNDGNALANSGIMNSHIVSTQKCKYCDIEVTDSITQKCSSCSSPICKNCAKQCNNKNANHPYNYYCEDCFAQCSLCLETKQCLTCTKKCFFKGCSNYLCNTCYDKNKHQLRPENTNCKFYKCDNCQTDANCIMTTVYCAKCDRRVCKNCFHREHKAHILPAK